MKKSTNRENEQYYDEIYDLVGGLPFIVEEIPRNPLMLKEGEFFMFAHEDGDMPLANRAGLGLYYKDTRYLSVFETYIDNFRPVLLSSTSSRNFCANIQQTNPAIVIDNRPFIREDSLNLRRTRLINEGMHEKIEIVNFSRNHVMITMRIRLGCDFSDIFEIRGIEVIDKPALHKPRTCPKGEILFTYKGNDEYFRSTRILMFPYPDIILREGLLVEVAYRLSLSSHQSIAIYMQIEPYISFDEVERTASKSVFFTDSKSCFEVALIKTQEKNDNWTDSCTGLQSDNQIFNVVLERGALDTRTLLTEFSEGTIPVAGLPWFMAAFGRDSLITALQSLILNPNIARDTLKFLSKFQGRVLNDWKDEEPGKIFHEIRTGELSNVNYIPHTPYFGTVDATPLFLVLFSEYINWTNDMDLFYELSSSVDAALDWVMKEGDIDGDGLIEYSRRSKRGLKNHFWKDSSDSLIMPDGSAPEPPVATVETQGYAFFGLNSIADILEREGETARASELKRWAQRLKSAFEENFWSEEDACYAMALDGNKNKTQGITSNAGHILFTGIADKDRALSVIKHMLSEEMYSGWGIRTLSKSGLSYNPMSYHNGSIWPHDNAIVLKGIKQCGAIDEFAEGLTGLFEAACSMQYMRLPELFCGFDRVSRESPISYPVACSPQAWSASAVFLLIQSMLGLAPSASSNTLFVIKPFLPKWLRRMNIYGLRVGNSDLDLSFSRDGAVTSFSVTRKSGGLRIILEE